MCEMYCKASNQVFHEIAKIGNNGNIGRRYYVKTKIRATTPPHEYWIWDLSHLDLMLSSLSYQGMCYSGDLGSSYGHT